MSPREMANASRCVTGCPECAAKRARRLRIIGFALQVVAWVALIAAFPVDGPRGVGLAIGGIALNWVGYYVAVVRTRQIVAEPLHQAERDA